MYTEGEIRESLVDVKEDPGEMKNLATLPEYEEALIAHRRYLNRWIEESGDTEAKAFAVGPIPASHRQIRTSLQNPQSYATRIQ